jgi:hypothetical protein
MKLKDYDKTLEVVKQAVMYFTNNDIVLVCYFVLIKCLVDNFKLNINRYIGILDPIRPVPN